MRLHGVQGSDTCSPREILQLAYKIGFINDSSVWLLMLKKRNTSVHIYNEAEIDEMIMLIRDSFPASFLPISKRLCNANWQKQKVTGINGTLIILE